MKSTCKGEALFEGVDNLGGHVEDYIGDPENPAYYPKKMEWVNVSQSFKKN